MYKKRLFLTRTVGSRRKKAKTENTGGLHMKRYGQMTGENLEQKWNLLHADDCDILEWRIVQLHREIAWLRKNVRD
jgi:hypothetical protein